MIEPDAFRASWPSVVRILASRTGDLDGAEEAAAEAFARAAATPDPIDELTAWCVQAGFRIWVDRQRRALRHEQLIAQIPDATDSTSRDDRIDLLAVVCDPALSGTSQLALALRVVLGVPTDTIAAHLGGSRAAAAARITRAKRELADAQGGFRIPEQDERLARRPLMIQCVASLHAIAARRCLTPANATEDLGLAALTLATGLVEEHADAAALGVRALVRIALARRPARVVGGVAVPFDELAVDRVDWPLLAEGLRDGAAARDADPRNPWSVEAAIAALYATAPDPGAPDWPAIRTAHAVLLRLDPSPSRDLAAAIADAHAGIQNAPARIAELAAAGPSYLARDAALALADLDWRAGDRGASSARYRSLLDTGALNDLDPAIRAFAERRAGSRP